MPGCKEKGRFFGSGRCDSPCNCSSNTRERFRVVTSSQSNSRNAVNVTDGWDLTVDEDLKGDSSFNDIDTGLCSSTLNQSSPRLPYCRCSDVQTVIFWYTRAEESVLFFYFLYLYLFCRQGICHLQFLYWNYLFICHHVAYFQIGDICLIYWFHCTNVLLFCVSCFTQWPLRFITSADTCFLPFLLLC